jgi:hypothetical protein
MPADDQTAPSPRHHEIKIPAVLVPSGQHPDPEAFSHLSRPVRLPVRIQGPGNGSDAQTTGAAQPQAGAAGSQSAPQSLDGQSSGDPNMPIGTNGLRSMAPRRVLPASGSTSDGSVSS